MDPSTESLIAAELHSKKKPSYKLRFHAHRQTSMQMEIKLKGCIFNKVRSELVQFVEEAIQIVVVVNGMIICATTANMLPVCTCFSYIFVLKVSAKQKSGKYCILHHHLA